MKFIKKIGFFTAFILPPLVVVGFYQGNWWNFIALGFVFVIITIIDFLIGLDTDNVPQEEVGLIGEELYYRLVTYLWTFLQLAFLAWAFYAVNTGMLDTLYEWIGFVISTGLVTGGIGITVAHELGHKKSALERFYSKILLMTVCYMHFYIEHNRGHHVYVATPEDPATAQKNQNFYSFWVRSVFHGYAHAWSIETKRLIRNGIPPLSLKNDMIWFTLWPLIFCGLVTVVFSLIQNHFSWAIPVFFFAQSIVAFTLLELVNYVEHYGILRKKTSGETYERVNPLHSWNTSHLVSNLFLFQLQRHSDHHANAVKRYQVLNHYADSPQLPFGYPTMILVALLPPLWFAMMNPRLQDWEDKVCKHAIPA